MATKQLRVEDLAALNVYFTVWRSSDNLIFDFDDNTFKAVGAATTPYLTATESTDPAGSGRSHYTASLDMALIASGLAPVDVFVQPFQRLGGSPAPLTDTSLAAPVSLRLRFGLIDPVLGGRINSVFKRELDTWDADFILTADGEPVSFNGTGALSVRGASGTLLFTALASSTITDAVDSLKHLRFTKLTPGFTGDRDYSARVVLTEGGATFTVQDVFTILA